MGIRYQCAENNAKGGACGTPARGKPDPDGVRRCFNHSTDPLEAAKRELANKAKKAAGIEGKRREIQYRRHLAASGVDMVTERVPGKTGPKPLPGNRKVPEVLEPQTPAELMGDLDISTHEGRENIRQRVVEGVATGVIMARDGDVMLKAAKDQGAERGTEEGRRTLSVRFETITTREEAEAYTEAQLIKQGAH